jgi:hypothetical protein
MKGTGKSGETDRRTFLKQGTVAAVTVGLGAALPACGETSEAPADGGQDLSGETGTVGDLEPGRDGTTDALDGAAPGKRPCTTVRQRITGVLAPEKQPSSRKKQWGVTRLVAGEKHQRTDLLKVDATATPPTGTPASLFYMLHLSDAHIVDEESPARAVSMDDTFGSAWRNQESYTTQVLDAMLRKIHEFDAFRHVDLVLLSGDCIDNNQENELAWLLKVFEGGTVIPNSGSIDDPVAGAGNDPHDIFTARGLGGIPWLLSFGNHDSLVQGNFFKDMGGGKFSLLLQDPTRDTTTLAQLGRVNTPACNPIPGDMAPLPRRCRPTDHSRLKPGKLPSDTTRAHLSRKEWMSMVHAAGGQPSGHGLSSANVSSGRADYTVDPVPGLPLRLVVMDTAADTFPPGAEGIYTNERIANFLQPALKKAEEDGVLVIVASHHPSQSVPFGGGAILKALGGCPNVVLHLCGHKHRNRVIPRPGASPAYGYWEVETCALIDWPQQGRLVELVDNRNGTAEIWLTMFDYDTDHRPLGAEVEGSRFYALKEVHSGEEGSGGEGKATDRNVTLPVAIPATVQKRLALLKGAAIESMLF